MNVPPGQVPHYSHSPHLPLFFYGGWASSMAPWKFRARMLFDTPEDSTYVGSNGDPIYPTYFHTREHWFHAHKTTDLQVVQAIAEQDDPWEAKALGRSHLCKPPEDWDLTRAYQVMLTGIRIQLDRHGALRELLRATGDRFIAEVSSQGDMIWGIHDPRTGAWDGKNWLGAAWMEARAEL